MILAGDGAGTVTSDPAGISCTVDGGMCTATFEAGTTVTLTGAPASADDAFEGWSGACSGSGACSLTLSADASVTADFDDTTVTTASIGTDGGTVTSPDGVLELVIPAGALGSEEQIRVRRLPTEEADPSIADLIDPAQITDLFDLGADGLTFDEPVEVRIRTGRQAADNPLSRAAGILVSVADGVAEPLAEVTSVVDPGTGEIVQTGLLSHFSELVHVDPLFTVTIEGVPDRMQVGQQVQVKVSVAVSAFVPAHVLFDASYSDASTAPLSASPGSAFLGIMTGNVFEGEFTYTCTAPGDATYEAEVTFHLPGDDPRLDTTVTLSKPVRCDPDPGKKLTINFTGDGSGRVTSDPEGIDCASDEACMASFPDGTVVTLTATPEEGSTFCGWTGGGGEAESSPTIQVTMDQDGSVTACFDREDDDGTGTPAPSSSFIELDTEEISFEHIISSDPDACPQDIGTVTITNTSDEAVEWELDTGSGAIDAAPAFGSLPPGESVTVELEFNCTTTQSFTATASVTATAPDGTTGTVEFTINANIQ